MEGRKPVPPETVAEAKRLYRRSPKTGKRRSYRAIAAAPTKRYPGGNVIAQIFWLKARAGWKEIGFGAVH